MSDRPAFLACELKDGSAWYVRVLWGRRPVEHINGFKSEHEAEAWIANEAEAWLERNQQRKWAAR
jgi:hypothetical protein